jgi:hypothetical protein
VQNRRNTRVLSLLVVLTGAGLTHWLNNAPCELPAHAKLLEIGIEHSKREVIATRPLGDDSIENGWPVETCAQVQRFDG